MTLSKRSELILKIKKIELLDQQAFEQGKFSEALLVETPESLRKNLQEQTNDLMVKVQRVNDKDLVELEIEINHILDLCEK